MFWIHRVVLFVHVVFAFLYMLSHGTSVAVADPWGKNWRT